MLFQKNKYTRWYTALIERARNRKVDGIVEWHHVVPSALGGKEGEQVALTLREHFICHLLLCRMTVGENRSKMCKAVWMMKERTNGVGGYTSKLYEFIRGQFIIEQSANAARMWSNPEHRSHLVAKKTGRKNTPETIEKMREAARRRHREKPLSPESIEAMRTKLQGRTVSEETRKRISAAQLGKPKTRKLND